MHKNLQKLIFLQYALYVKLYGFQDLLKWIDCKCEKAEKPRISMETTGAYMKELAEFMNDNGFEVSVVNPLLIKRSAKPKMHQRKTDKADAQQIIKYCLDNNPRFWKPRQAEYSIFVKKALKEEM